MTMSGLKRVTECPASVVLPQHKSMSRPASKGTAIHAFLANVPEMGRSEALALVDEEYVAACEAIDLSTLPACEPGSWAVEIKLAYDPVKDTARELGRGSDRDYSGAKEGEDFCGTLDVLGLTPDAVVVIDYKSGWKDLGPVRDNMQLRSGALAACRAFDRERAHVAILRLKEDGESFYQWATLEPLELAATQQAILEAQAGAERAALQLANGEHPTLSQGEWCGFCPAFPTCPAKAKLAAALGSTEVRTSQDGALVGSTSIWELSLPVLSKETAPSIVESIARAKEVVAFIEGKLDEYAKENPFELGQGWWYGARPLPRDHIDAARAVPIIEKMTDARVAEECVKVTRAVPKSKLTDAIRDYKTRKPGVKIGATVDAILEELEKEGAVTRTFTHPIGKFKLGKG